MKIIVKDMNKKLENKHILQKLYKKLLVKIRKVIIIIKDL